LLLLGLVFIGLGAVALLSSSKSVKGSTVDPANTAPQRNVLGDLAVACGVVSVMFVLQNAILAAFHTGMPFHRHVELG
jgi:hypothetical protein